MPQLVSENKDGIKKVDYSSLAGFLIQVNKEQQVQLDKQQYEINEMESKFKNGRTWTVRVREIFSNFSVALIHIELKVQ